MMWRIMEGKKDQTYAQFEFTGGIVPGDSVGFFDNAPEAGKPNGVCAVPPEAQAADTSNPASVIGDGTPASCTSQKVIDAVAGGGVITFNCGPNPVTVKMDGTAKVFNDKAPEIVIDGGGLVTLDGQNQRRILYMNTCDSAQVWTTSHCDNQETPRLTVQNITFINGNSSNGDTEGGGAIYAQGGTLKVVNSRFFNNSCNPTGPDVGGAAVRAFEQFNNLPLYVVHSTFGGAEGYGNSCSNGGGLSSIGVSYTVINSLFSNNSAIGNGANPAKSGTPGGGSGAAIYNDGNDFNLTLCGTAIHDNVANEGGGAIFFVSNDLTGNLIITDSELKLNQSKGFETPGFPGIFYLGEGDPQVTNSVIE
jgi:predicted outer membrane repeat protein